jgi:hypothetical protein
MRDTPTAVSWFGDCLLWFPEEPLRGAFRKRQWGRFCGGSIPGRAWVCHSAHRAPHTTCTQQPPLAPPCVPILPGQHSGVNGPQTATTCTSGSRPGRDPRHISCSTHFPIRQKRLRRSALYLQWPGQYSRLGQTAFAIAVSKP